MIRIPFIKFVSLIGISTLFLFEYFSLNLLNAIEPSIANEFNCTHVEIGWLGSVYFCAMVILLVPAGHIIDKYNLKKVIVFSAIGGTVGTFLLSISQTYVHLIIGRTIVGICLGPFALISCIKFISKFAKREEVGKFISVTLFIGILGGAFSQDVFGLLVNNMGWRKALFIVSVLGVCISIILALTVNLYKDIVKTTQYNFSFFEMCTFFIKKTNISINFKLGIMASVLNLPLFVLGSLFGITFLEQCYTYPAIIASGITAYLFYGMLFGSVLFGLLSSRGFKENVLLIVGGLILLIALSLLTLLPVSNELVLKIIFFAIGIGSGSNVLSYSLIEKISNYRNLGLAEGFHSALIFIGGGLIQPIFGKILDMSRLYMIKYDIDLVLNSKIPFHLGFVLLIILVLVGLYCIRTLGNSNNYRTESMINIAN